MVVPQFLRFYSGYTNSKAMGEYAKTFFSLVNSMFRLQAEESLTRIVDASAAVNGGEGVIDKYKQASQGISGMVREAKIIKEVRSGKH